MCHCKKICPLAPYSNISVFNFSTDRTAETDKLLPIFTCIRANESWTFIQLGMSYLLQKSKIPTVTKRPAIMSTEGFMNRALIISWPQIVCGPDY